ncbi:MAG: sodium:solute symporter family protein [Sedimentisphaerales bacterium]
MGILDYILMVAFLVILMALGLFFTRKEKNTNDYLLAGGKVAWWAIAISYVMALTSTVSLVSTPGEAYNNGLRLYIMEWFAPITGLVFFFLFMRFYFTTKTFTPFTYLERRFDARMRGILSTVYFFSRASILAMVIFTCGMVFKGLADWPLWVAIVVIGISGTIYCTLGGFKAVIWTNVLQFFVLGGGLLVTIIACVSNVEGGFTGVIKYAFSNGRGFNFDAVDANFFSFDPHVRLTFWLLLLGSVHGYMFYNSADQIAVQQLLSTSSYKEARKSFITTVIIFVPLGAVLWFMGIAMFAYFGQHPLAGGNPSGDIALFTFIKIKLPQPIPGLLASAMLAAALSTIGALVMGLSTVVTKDFYLRFFRPNATEHDQVAVSRILTLFFGVFGTGMALIISFSSSSLGETVVEANAIWGAFVAVIAPIFFIGVINPRCNAYHALISLIFGSLVITAMILWYVQSRIAGNPISYIAIAMPGFLATIVCGLTLPFVFGERPPKEKLKNLTIWTLTHKI